MSPETIRFGSAVDAGEVAPAPAEAARGVESGGMSPEVVIEVDIDWKVDAASERFVRWLRTVSDEFLAQYICRLARAFLPRFTEYVCSVANDALRVLKGSRDATPEAVYGNVIYAEGICDGILDVLGKYGEKAIILDALVELEDRLGRVVEVRAYRG